MTAFRKQQSLPRIYSAKPITLTYEQDAHRELPHVLKFSGGRSSAMLLIGLLYGKQLRPSRGDVIVFNNTSAEHTATYVFAAICKRIAEERFNIPFIWTEFQTYEDVFSGNWRRLAGYRMVLPHRYTVRTPRGYLDHGEIFEELISWKQQLPTRFNRLCTQHLKLQTTAMFLQDWFGRSPSGASRECNPCNQRLGHWYGSSMVDLKSYRDRQSYARYLLTRPYTRQRQRFQEFTKAHLGNIKNRHLTDKAFDGKAPLKGEGHVEYLSLIGLRADEQRRVIRVLARNNEINNDSDVERLADGEHVYTPLYDLDIGKEEVLDFWQKQSWDLAIPHDINLSNCVYCFMKGERAIREIAAQEPSSVNSAYTPRSIDWWANIEHRYARELPSSRDPQKISRFGFFGANSNVTYQNIIQTINLSPEQVETSALPCDCTD